jgi:hypothetical protein
MPFDPSQPYETVESDKPQFDPSQPFEAVGSGGYPRAIPAGKPKFDPTQPHEIVTEPTQALPRVDQGNIVTDTAPDVGFGAGRATPYPEGSPGSEMPALRDSTQTPMAGARAPTLEEITKSLVPQFGDRQETVQVPRRPVEPVSDWDAYARGAETSGPIGGTLSMLEHAKDQQIFNIEPILPGQPGEHAFADAARFLNTPAGISTLAVGGGTGAVSTLMQLGFTAQIADQAVRQAQQGEYRKAAETALMAGLPLALHALGGKTEGIEAAPGETPPVEAPPVEPQPTTGEPSLDAAMLAREESAKQANLAQDEAVAKQAEKARLDQKAQSLGLARPQAAPPEVVRPTEFVNPELSDQAVEAPLARGTGAPVESTVVEHNVGEDSSDAHNRILQAYEDNGVNVTGSQELTPEQGATENRSSFQHDPATPEQLAAVSQDLGQEPKPYVPEEKAPVPTDNTTGVSAADIEAQRGTRELPAIERQKQMDFGQSLDAAKATLAEDPLAGQRLVDELSTKTRAINPEETPLLVEQMQKAQREFDSSVQAVNTATPDTLLDARARLDDARTAYDKVTKVVQDATSKTGAGLNSVKMLLDDKYSLAKTEARMRAANNGMPLSDREYANTKALHDKTTEAQSKFNEAAQAQARINIDTDFQKAMRDSRAEARKAARVTNKATDFFDRQAEKARASIVERRGRLNVGYDPKALYDEAMIGASHIAHGITDFAEWSKAMIADLGDRIKPFLQDLYARAKQLHEDSAKTFAANQGVALDKYKSGLIERTQAIKDKIASGDMSGAVRAKMQLDSEAVALKTEHQRQSRILDLARRTDAIKERIASGDISKATRLKTQLDREVFARKAEYEKSKRNIDSLVMKKELQGRPMARRLADRFVQAERAIKLTGLTTIEKLGGAAVTRIATRPVELGVQSILGQIPVLRTVAEAATAERGLRFGGEMAAVKGIYKGIKQIPQMFREHGTAEDVLYGKGAGLGIGEPHSPGGVIDTILDIPGRTHGAIKQPVKMSEFYRTKANMEDLYRKQGKDLSDPRIQKEIGDVAYNNAQRAIFMQDNFANGAFRDMLRSLETNKTAPNLGFATSKIAQFLLPIVKVPLNIVGETAVHMGGTVSGSIKLAGVMKRGLENIKPEEANYIMRHYSKGLIGIGLFATGYFNPNSFSGFYQERTQGKDTATGLKYGRLKALGYTIPAILLHAPAFIVMQAGATARKMVDRGGGYIVPGQSIGSRGGVHTKPSAAMAIMTEMGNEIPFIRQMGAIDAMIGRQGDYKQRQALGSTVQGSVIPQGLKNIAAFLDRPKNANWLDLSEGTARRKQAITDYLMEGIPGLRKTLPAYKD